MTLGLHILAVLLLSDVSVSQLRRSSGKSSGAAQVVDFDCPEEFGYYPHPGDCTQYYVCVFGGALLESCTGGLMYSHELQTCDWPRNVGCGEPAARPAPYIQQRDEAIPKHHLYAEEELGPAEEVESDRQQRVYRGQPSTLNQVARDRDGLSRHSNALQVSPNGREKLSVISFGTQQQYSRQSIQPASYLESTTTQRVVTSRGHNTTQQQQYTPSPYDAYYNIYEDDAELYKDIDYSQYQPSAKQPQQSYNAVQQSQQSYNAVQQPQQSLNSVQQPQQSYKTVQQAQDYTDNYNLQEEDYKQADIDLKGNRSRPSQNQESSTIEAGTITNTEDKTGFRRNPQITLKAALSFDNGKTPIISSTQLALPLPTITPLKENRSEEYFKEGTSHLREDKKLPNREQYKDEVVNNLGIKTKTQQKLQSRISPNPFAHYSVEQEPNQLSSKSLRENPPLDSPLRIMVPSTSVHTYSEEVTFRPRYIPTRGSRPQNKFYNTTTESNKGTLRSNKLHSLTRDIVSSQRVIQDRVGAMQMSPLEKTDNVHPNIPATNVPHTETEYVTINPKEIVLQTTQENTYSKVINFDNSQDFRRRPFKTTQQETYQLTDSGIVMPDLNPYVRKAASSSEDVKNVFKFIPINNVRTRFSSGGRSNNTWTTKLDNSQIEARTVLEQTVLNKEPESIFPKKSANPQVIPITLYDQNTNYQGPGVEEKNLNIKEKQINRIESRSKETPKQKSLYSLRNDEQTGKYIGKGNGIVLATLKSIINDKTSHEVEVPSLEITNVEPEVQNVQGSQHEDDNSESLNIDFNVSQFRTRQHGTTFVLTNHSKRDDYYTTQQSVNAGNESDKNPYTPSARKRSKPNQNKTYNNNFNIHSQVQSPFETQEILLNDNATEGKLYSIDKIFPITESNVSFTNRKLETDYIKDHKRRQFKGRNRLRTNPQTEQTKLEKDNDVLNFHEGIPSIENSKITSEEDIIKSNAFPPQSSEIDDIHKTVDTYSDSVKRVVGERQDKTRQMTVRKPITHTSLQTPIYSSRSKSRMRSNNANPISTNEDSDVTTESYVTRKNNDNDYQHRASYHERDFNRIVSKEEVNLISNTTTSPPNGAITLLRSSSDLRENDRQIPHQDLNYTSVGSIDDVSAKPYQSYSSKVADTPDTTYDALNIYSQYTTTIPPVTVDKIRDKIRMGKFPIPNSSSKGVLRKPSVDDSTSPPLPSEKCSQELDNTCHDKPVTRVRPTSDSLDIQTTAGWGSSRSRGSATYTTSPNEAEPSPTPNRGTPSSLNRNRPTLKPSTSIVSKALEFIDIFKYPPSRPEPIYPTPQVDKTAAKCRKDVCLLPDCSCGGKDIPGDLTLEETPQIILLTFDDSVNDLNKGLYSDLFEKGRTNPNGCPITSTFYVSHEWTDYSQVQNLYSNGHEMASHTVSHSFGEQFSVKKWTKEVAGQREILSAYGGVRLEDIRGMRAPFLSIGGNKMFKMLYDSNFTYDSSMPVYENKPPSWPYTLDYKIFHDCMIPPCPTRSYPGVWEVPMVMWQDLNGGRCSMGDACSNPPKSDGVYKMLIKNFERHFTSNRAPFGLFYHAAWFTQPHHKEGFIAFLDAINKMPEVWVVTNWQAIQWVRDPTPISRLNNFAPFQCDYPERPRRCNNPKVCNLWHKSGVRYMRTCQPCPEIYPWTGKSGVRNSRVDNEIITE